MSEFASGGEFPDEPVRPELPEFCIPCAYFYPRLRRTDDRFPWVVYRDSQESPHA